MVYFWVKRCKKVYGYAWNTVIWCNWELKASVLYLAASTSPEVLAAHKAEIWSSLDEKTKAVYGEAYLERLYSNFETHVPTFPVDVGPVVAAMRSALFSKRPKTRYTIGRGTSTLMYLLMVLPCWISDRLSMAMSITSRDACPTKLQQSSDSVM